MQRRVLGLVAVLTVVVGALLVTTSAPASAAPTTLTLQGVVHLDGRLDELTFFSPALERATKVRVLHPAGFDPTTDDLPVLWLLHGGFGGFADWTTVGDAEALTAGLPLLVVMPDTGPGGWYSDWKDPATSQGPMRWETFHLRELYPWIHAHYGGRDDRSGNAIAGLSMGGFGAMHDAARHPDLFGFAASFSGAVDLLNPGVGLVTDLSPFIIGGSPTQIWGDRVTQESRWRAHNPVDLAPNLRTLTLQVRTGDGLPGGPHGGGDPIEAGVWLASHSLHGRLDTLGIPHLFLDYGPGGHQWPYWQDDLVATLPAIMAATATVRPDPTTVTHIAFEPTYSVWGHTVALQRPVYERSTLAIRPNGFALTGTGSGTVTTPARYRPGQTLHAVSRLDGGAPSTQDLVADAAGRVTVPVDLGPASAIDEYPLATVAPLPHPTVDVTLTAVTAEPATPAADVPASVEASGATTLPATGTSSSAPLVAVLVVVALAVHRLRRTP